MLDCDECHQAFERVAAAKETIDGLKTSTWLESADQITYWAEQSGWKIYPFAHICYRCCHHNEQLHLTQTDIYDPDYHF